MVVFQWNQELKNLIPNLFIFWAIIKGVTIKTSFTDLDDLKKEIFTEIKSKHTIESIKNDLLVRNYRQFFWKHTDFDPTKIRPASEALVRRILSGKNIPIINNVVFACNLASIKTFITFSAFNLSKINENVIIRFSRKDEPFTEIGGQIKNLKEKQVIMTDSEKILCIYPHRDSDLTKVDKNTKDLLLVAYGVPNIEKSKVENALKTLISFINLTAGGHLTDQGSSFLKDF